jgi:hypothetical protein
MDPNYALLNLSSVLNRIDSKKNAPVLTAMALSSTAARPVAAITGAHHQQQHQTTASATTTAVKKSKESTSTESCETTENDNKDKDSEERPSKSQRTDSDERDPKNDKKEEEDTLKDPLLTVGKEDIWHEFIDPSSGKSYYHNYTTGQTSWDKPAHFIPFVAPIAPAAFPLAAAAGAAIAGGMTPSSSSLATTGSYQDYRSVAYFNSNNGRYTGNTNYWEKVGRPEDKAGRQLSAFIDLNELERNRAETKAKREEFQRNLEKQGVNWKELKEEQKLKKRKNREKWLLED